MGSVVVFQVPSALAGLHPHGGRDPAGIVRRQRFREHARDRFPALPLLGARNPPPVRREPVHRRAVDGAADAVIVDAEIVPVHQVDQVVERETPGGVGRLVGGAGGQSAFAFEDEDLHPIGARALQGQRDARRGGAAVTRWAGVELQEQGPALHLRVSGKPPAPAEARQVFPVQRAMLGVADMVALVAGLAVLEPHRLVQHREGAVDERDGVAGAQHEAVREATGRIADVPPHRPAQEGGEQDGRLGPRASGVPALAVVDDDIDELIDQVPDRVPVGEGMAIVHALPSTKVRSRRMPSSIPSSPMPE